MSTKRKIDEVALPLKTTKEETDAKVKRPCYDNGYIWETHHHGSVRYFKTEKSAQEYVDWNIGEESKSFGQNLRESKLRVRIAQRMTKDEVFTRMESDDTPVFLLASQWVDKRYATHEITFEDEGDIDICAEWATGKLDFDEHKNWVQRNTKDEDDEDEDAGEFSDNFKALGLDVLLDHKPVELFEICDPVQFDEHHTYLFKVPFMRSWLHVDSSKAELVKKAFQGKDVPAAIYLETYKTFTDNGDWGIRKLRLYD
jgi:hypothetical protein